MKTSLRLICIVLLALSLLFEVEGGKIKNGGGSGGALSNVGKAVGRSGLAKKGLGKKAAAAAVVVGGGAAGYVAYKGIKKAVKHGRHDDSSEEYYGDRGYGGYGRERNQYYASEGLRISGWNLNFLILPVVALRAIKWY